MQIIIHRGQNQIGGNIIEISTNNAKILLDIGLGLDDDKNKELPKIEGLFDKKRYDAVFVSHYHSDHLGLAYQIHKDIPIYIGEASYKVICASDEYKHDRTFDIAGFLQSGVKIQIGDISVCPYLCDHSAYDSYMLLCESGGEAVLYTGDFRANGRKPFDWLLKQLPSHVDKLICEGTTLTRDNYISQKESALEEQAMRLFKEHKGPVFVLQSSMNIDRIVTMYRSAKKSNRIFLQELYMAEIATAIGGSIPNPEFPDVFAFITNSNRYDKLCKYRHRIGKENIAKSKFVMCVRTSMLKYLRSLSELMSFEDGLLVYSFWSGYKENESMKVFLSACKDMGIDIVTLHTSGHADADTIDKLIDTVNPDEIIPVHTENAEWFKKYHNTSAQ